MAARVRLFALVGLTGVVSRSGPVLGPYMYRFSRTTSLASADLRGAEHGALEGRELFGPAVVVGRVEAEVHGVGVGRHVAGEVEVGGVTADGLDAGEDRGAASVDHANTGALVEEGGGDGTAGGAGAEHDVRSAAVTTSPPWPERTSR